MKDKSLYSIAAKKRMKAIPPAKLKERMRKLAQLKNSKMTKEQRSDHAKKMVSAREAHKVVT